MALTTVHSEAEICKGIVDHIREWLKRGWTIKASDPNRVLEILPDGTVYSNLTITGPGIPEYKEAEHYRNGN